MTPTFKDAQQAFDEAIATGRLSLNRDADNYAGDFMYIHRLGNTSLSRPPMGCGLRVA